MKQLFRLMVAIFCLVAVVACGDSKKTVTNTVKALISAEKGGTLDYRGRFFDHHSSRCPCRGY